MYARLTNRFRQSAELCLNDKIAKERFKKFHFKLKTSDKKNYNLKRKFEPLNKKKLKQNHSNKIILKPWGFETLIKKTNKMAFWFLFVKKNYETSLHCHSRKKTILLVLDGKIRFKTLNKTLIVKKNQYIVIEKKVFHQTKSVSKNSSLVLEIETPVDKQDLIRLYDKYHRVGKEYEKIENKDKLLKRKIYKNISTNIEIFNSNRVIKKKENFKYLALSNDKLINVEKKLMKDLYLFQKKFSKNTNILALRKKVNYDYNLINRVNKQI